MRTEAGPQRNVATNDESRLVALLQAGDPVAFESIFRAYAESLADLAYGYVQSRDAAEDIVQELFVWLWAHRHEFVPSHGLRAYLFGAARNRALNTLRNEATAVRAAASIVTNGPRPHSSADDAVLTSDLEFAIRTAIDGLPPRCRDVFTLVRTRSLSYADVATILGIAPKTVEVHMSRALAILRLKLGPWLNGDP